MTLSKVAGWMFLVGDGSDELLQKVACEGWSLVGLETGLVERGARNARVVGRR